MYDFTFLKPVNLDLITYWLLRSRLDRPTRLEARGICRRPEVEGVVVRAAVQTVTAIAIGKEAVSNLFLISVL